MYCGNFRDTQLNISKRMSKFLIRNFQLLGCCGLLHQFSVAEIFDTFCDSVGTVV